MAETKTELLPEVSSLAGLVEYQTGAVTSRTLVKKPGGTVTLFAFDQGEEISSHTSTGDAMVLALEGEAEVTISGQQHSLRAGEVIVMPAGQPHAVRAAERFKMLLVVVFPASQAAA